MCVAGDGADDCSDDVTGCCCYELSEWSAANSDEDVWSGVVDCCETLLIFELYSV